MSLEDLFCDVDDFCRRFLPDWHRPQLQHGERKRLRGCRMALSELMTIRIHFHHSQYRNLKAYYVLPVGRHLANEFSNRLSYNRLVAVIPTVLMPLCVYLHTRKGQATGIAFLDPTSLVVCHNRRIHSPKVFKQLARRGKPSVGWFYGFTLPLLVKDRGELLAFRITPGKVDDRQPVPQRVKGVSGTLFGDRGSICQKRFETLREHNLQLITRLRKPRRNKLLPLADTRRLRKRALIETLNDPLTNISQIEPTRHRSGINAMVKLLAGLVA